MRIHLFPIWLTVRMPVPVRGATPSNPCPTECGLADANYRQAVYFYSGPHLKGREWVIGRVGWLVTVLGELLGVHSLIVSYSEYCWDLVTSLLMGLRVPTDEPQQRGEGRASQHGIKGKTFTVLSNPEDSRTDSFFCPSFQSSGLSLLRNTWAPEPQQPEFQEYSWLWSQKPVIWQCPLPPALTTTLLLSVYGFDHSRGLVQVGSHSICPL